MSNWFDEHEDDITGAIENIADFFENTLGPAVITFWEDVFKPFLGDFIDGILEVGGSLIELFGGGRKEFFDVGLGVVSLGPEKTFRTFLKEIEDTLDEFLAVGFPKLWKDFRTFVLDFLGLPNWEAIAEAWRGVWDLLGTIVDTWIEDFKSKFTLENLFSNIFGEGRGVFGDFNKMLEEFGFDPLGPSPLGQNGIGPPDPNFVPFELPSGFIPPTPSPVSSQETNLNLTIHTNAPVEPIVADFRMMRAMKGRV